jgi:hypothetical protein
MLKTLKQFPKNLASNPVSVVVQEAAANVLSANMNVLYVTRDQGKKVFIALKETAGDLATQNVKRLKITVDAANDKACEAWDTVEKVLEERVIPVLGKVGLAAPAQFGVGLFGKGLQKVSAQVVELTRERKLAARRSAVKKPVAKKIVANSRARSAGVRSAKLAA